MSQPPKSAARAATEPNVLGIIVCIVLGAFMICVLAVAIYPFDKSTITVCQDPSDPRDQSHLVSGEDWEEAVGVTTPGPGFFRVYRKVIFNDVQRVEMLQMDPIC